MSRTRALAASLAVVLLVPLSGASGAPRAPGGHNQIQHILVLMQENRSFDSYLGRLYVQGQPRSTPMKLSRHNPNPKGGKPIYVFHKKYMCEVADLDHSWNGSHLEYHHGKMDGFTKANVDPEDPTGRRAMGYYTKKELPFYYWLYRTFAIGDRYFQSVLSQTFPNRFYLLAGTSFGHIRNDYPTDPDQFSQKTIFNELDDAGITWRIYYSQVPFAFVFSYVRDNAAGHVFPIQQYYDDAQAGSLPQVSFIDPILIGQANTENDEHPPSNVQVGEAFVHDVVQGLVTSPSWHSSALFVTYDEHGGFADHVPPPRAVKPDNIEPMLEEGDVKAAFDRLGFRVPAVVVSPWAKKHFVSHVVHDHTSILRTIESRFGLPALTKRDRAAKPMWEFFNFSKASFSKPPAVPPSPINQKQMQSDSCQNGSNST